jgi:hypothetical protein
MTTLPIICAVQRKVQFCTLVQVPIRLYCDSRNRNKFAPSLNYAICLCGHWIINDDNFADCSYIFRTAYIMCDLLTFRRVCGYN